MSTPNSQTSQDNPPLSILPGVRLVPHAEIEARVTEILRRAEREQLRLNAAKIAWRWAV